MNRRRFLWLLGIAPSAVAASVGPRTTIGIDGGGDLGAIAVKFESGGFVLSDGIAHIHRGETVTPAAPDLVISGPFGAPSRSFGRSVERLVTAEMGART